MDKIDEMQVMVLGIPLYAGRLADAVKHVIETCLKQASAGHGPHF